MTWNGNLLKNIYIKSSAFFEIKKSTIDWIYEAYNLNAETIIDYADFKIIQKFLRKNGLQEVWNCSEEMQDALKILCWIENAERSFFRKERKRLLDSMRSFRILWGIKSAYSILYLFFTKKKSHKRIINIWENINYDWIDGDISYIKYMLKKIQNPERRSKVAYLLWKIKDKRIKRKFNKINKLPTQFDLLLQQCKKWQIMLTNWLNLNGSSSIFKDLTQVVSGCRWCHCLIISDVIRDKNWIVSDLMVIQSTLDSWVHEISFKKYIWENYSKSDFLLASFPRRKINPIILNIKNHIWQKYDKISMILDILAWGDVNSVKSLHDINKTYCAGLIFDAMKKSRCDVPESHLTPSDILLAKELTLEYACFCDEL